MDAERKPIQIRSSSVFVETIKARLHDDVNKALIRAIEDRDAEWTEAQIQLNRAIEEETQALPFDKRAADAMALEIDRLVSRGVIDSRAPAADAMMDYRGGCFCGTTKDNGPAEIDILREQVAELREAAKKCAIELRAIRSQVGIKIVWHDGASLDKALKTAETALSRMEAGTGKADYCEWSLDEPGYDAWKGSCGAMWCLIEGTPIENKMKYCPGCGKPIKQIDSPATDTP